MARRKLTIVVTCTDRKVAAPCADLMVRSLPIATVRERADAWVGRLVGAQNTTRLLDLYKGESWTQAKRLAATAHATGFEPEVFVASAGLGLRSVNDFGPSYAATFARGHEDSVVSAAADSRVWWGRLPRVSVPQDDVLSIWVLSESYALAMQDDLQTLDPSLSLVFGGASGTPEDARIRSDRNLRAALGGTTTSLNTRMANRWLEIADGRLPTSVVVRRDWVQWAQHAQQRERYDRRSLPDTSIRQLVEKMLGVHPELSKSRALSNLRASGIACEQRRFSGLFEEARKA